MKKNRLLYLIFYFLQLAFQGNGQNKTIDSLKKLVNEAKSDTARTKALSNLSYELMCFGSYDEAMEYAVKEKDISEKTNNKNDVSDAYGLFGNIWFEKGNYSESLKNYFKSLEIGEAIGDKIKIADATENIGLVYYVQNKLNEALQKHLIALKIYSELEKKEGVANTYINIGNIYAIQKNYPEALKNFFAALETKKESSDKHAYLMLLSNIGTLYGEQKNNSKAMKYNLLALKKAEELNDKTIIADVYNGMGNMFFLEQKNDSAIKYFTKGLEIATEIGNIKYIKDNYNGLALTYAQQNKYKEALSSYKNFIVYRDSLFNEENTKKSVRVEMQYDFNKKETATKAKQEIKDALAKEEIQKQRILKISVTAGSVLLIAIMLLFFNRRKAKHNLQVNKLENKTLRSQLNPHFIFNALASIQKYMNEHPQQAQNYLAKFGKLMREVLENSEKEYISLEHEFAMLKKYMDLETLRVTNGFDYEFIIDKNTDEETIQVPPLIFQPIVENAIWHGVANSTIKGKITIRAVMENTLLKVEVENNNNQTVPISSGKKEELKKIKSFGLQIVKERLTLLSKEKNRKGKLMLFPIENGMKVIVEIPI